MSNETRKCKVCEKDISDRVKNAKYCGTICSSRNKDIPKDLVYDIKIRRKDILKIKENMCYFCERKNSVGSGIKFHLHHIDYKSNDLDNLLLLCSRCHMRLHSIINKTNERDKTRGEL